MPKEELKRDETDESVVSAAPAATEKAEEAKEGVKEKVKEAAQRVKDAVMEGDSDESDVHDEL